MRDWFGDQSYAVWPWTRDELGDATPEVLPPAPEQLNFEQIARLRPDVLTGTFSAMTEDEYKTLAQIAPTVAQPGEYPDASQPWQEIIQVVGREERAKKLVAEIEAQFEATRRAHPNSRVKTPS